MSPGIPFLMILLKPMLVLRELSLKALELISSVAQYPLPVCELLNKSNSCMFWFKYTKQLQSWEGLYL